MFGCVVCNRAELTEAETERYQAFYCGLCNALKKRFGQMERLSLSFDMTFLALFLSALYEPQEAVQDTRCILHPLSQKHYCQNKYIDYAADMTVVMAYFKAKDDWEDEHKGTGYCYSKLLEKKYAQIKEKYPRQCQAVAMSIERLGEIEKSMQSIPDEAINCSGEMLAEIFVCEEDFWSDSLRRFGYELGRFIYMMDAALDYKEDIKKKNYNPLIKMQKKPNEIKEILSMMIGNATAVFEKLPIVQDDHMLRNILYSGVWQQYDTKVRRKEKAHGE